MVDAGVGDALPRVCPTPGMTGVKRERASPRGEIWRSVDYDEHCTVLVVIEDLPKCLFVVMKFTSPWPTLYAHMDAAMVPVYGCCNGLTIGCDMETSFCVHHGWTHGDPHFCEWRPSIACANGDPHLAETRGC